jgi:hypothetical protein
VPEQLEAYLHRLSDALRERGALDPRIVDEARAHLVDALEDGLRRGQPVDLAEREALARFGAPGMVAAHFAAERPHMLNRIVAVLCSFTLFATGYLSLSVIVLRPPRASYQAWFLMAALFVAQSVLTLAEIAGTARGGWIRGSLLAGSVAVIAVGAWWVHGTLAASHFEGYALVLGSLVAVQGSLTLLRLVPFDRLTIAARPN